MEYTLNKILAVLEARKSLDAFLSTAIEVDETPSKVGFERADAESGAVVAAINVALDLAEENVAESLDEIRILTNFTMLLAAAVLTLGESQKEFEAK